jgi:outer membrane protein OmpA-like peptidoglycan-associated protein
MIGKRRLALALVAALVASAGAASGTASRARPDFIIFFDWGKQEIRGEDKAVLDKAADEWRARPGSNLQVTGFSDRSGPGVVNLRASKRRAIAVRDYLVARGVPAYAIILHAYGEQQPVVATEDGVREVQNRRVEICFVPAG